MKKYMLVMMVAASLSGYVVADDAQVLAEEITKAVGVEEQTKLAKNQEADAAEILRVIQEVTDELTKEVVEEKKALAAITQDGVVDNNIA